MEVCITTEPQQGADYATIARIAMAAENLGFTGFFRSDHYLAMGDDLGLPGPTDAWITLAGLALQTSSIQIGTLVSPVTFRNPAQLAIIAAQVDVMSRGRVELGLGAGWFAQEHIACGLAFPKRRHAMLQEQLEVLTGLWATSVGARFSYSGDFYSMADSPALPKPFQRPALPIILGGNGPTRSPSLAARFATEYNVYALSPTDMSAAFARADEACRRTSRDPADLRHSVALTLACGHTDASVQSRLEIIGQDRESLEKIGLVGVPDSVAGRIAEYAEAGAQRIYLQVIDIADTDMVELFAAKVLPQLHID